MIKSSSIVSDNSVCKSRTSNNNLLAYNWFSLRRLLFTYYSLLTFLIPHYKPLDVKESKSFFVCF